MDQSISRLTRIVEAAARAEDVAAVRDAIESELRSSTPDHEPDPRPRPVTPQKSC
jgi:hypothetical protein